MRAHNIDVSTPQTALSKRRILDGKSPAYQSAPTPVYLEISFQEIAAAKTWSRVLERGPLLGYEYLFAVTVLESDESLYFFCFLAGQQGLLFLSFVFKATSCVVCPADSATRKS